MSWSVVHKTELMKVAIDSVMGGGALPASWVLECLECVEWNILTELTKHAYISMVLKQRDSQAFGSSQEHWQANGGQFN